MNEESNPKCTKTREAVYYGRKLTLRCTLRKNSHDVPDEHWDGREGEWWVEEETDIHDTEDTSASRNE